MAAAACEAVLPLLQAALGASGGMIPADYSGRVLLRIGESDGIVFCVQQGRGSLELWRGGTLPQANTTIYFDSVETLRKALQDQHAVPMLLMRRKLRLQGDTSFMTQFSAGSGSESAMARQFAKELDSAIAGSGGGTEEVVNWVPNEASNHCQECSQIFRSFRRRHHCRRCGRLLCGSCAPKVQENSGDNCLSMLSQGSRVRLCEQCQESGPQAPRSRSMHSHRASIMSTASAVTVGSDAVEAAMERLHEMKEEVAELRKAEKQRIERAARKGVQQIWLATYVSLLVLSFLLCLWRFSVAAAWLAFLVVLQHSSEGSLLQRNIRVFWAAAVVTITVLNTRWKLRGLNITEGEEYNSEWAATHQVIARFLYHQILKLKGFWIKLGQQLSVNVVMAAPYREEFGKLQDKIPSMPVSEVKRTLQEEFGKEVADTLSLDAEPLGTASIAQVHRAIWRPKGAAHREVVQHRGVAAQFHQDLRASAVLAKLLALVDPEGVPDMRPIISALREVTINELDFRLEAKNQSRAREAAERHRANVLIPEVVTELVAQRAMCMGFVHGESLAKAAKELTQEQRDALIANLADHFAVQFAVDGHFHADPHPGNLMVQTNTGRLVVLDWGMCITLSPQKTRAYAQLFVAAGTSNAWGVVNALRDIGVTFKEGDVFEPVSFLSFLRFGLRETQPQDEAKGQAESFMKAGDDLYERGPKRFKKSPFETFTGDLTYFFKALDLLWCVSSQLHTRHPILQTMFLRSCACLAGSQGVPRRLQELLPAPKVFSAQSNGLQLQLQQILQRFYLEGELLGAQLCVLDLSGPPKVLADLALGVQSWIHQEPVTPTTLFNLLDISKLIVAMSVLRLVDKGRLQLSCKLPLPEPVTVEQVLSHRAGYWQPLPDGIVNLPELADLEQMLSALQRTRPCEAPDAAQRYHCTSFGYLCALACREGGLELQQAWDELCVSAAAWADEVDLECPMARQTLARDQSAARVEGDMTIPDFEEVAEMISAVYMLRRPQQMPSSQPTDSPCEGMHRKTSTQVHEACYGQDSFHEG
ncbi:unnamed protein product [Effrenium voratum]|nr:unnamed protein product [Effrenium voratum]